MDEKGISNDSGLVHFPTPTLTDHETLELSSTVLVSSSQPSSDSPDLIISSSLFSYFQHEMFILCLDFLSVTDISNCILVSKYWQLGTKTPRVWLIAGKGQEKERKIQSRKQKMEQARILWSDYNEKTCFRPWFVNALQTPLHDVLFQLLVLISSILVPLQLDGIQSLEDYLLVSKYITHINHITIKEKRIRTSKRYAITCFMKVCC